MTVALVELSDVTVILIPVMLLNNKNEDDRLDTVKFVKVAFVNVMLDPDKLTTSISNDDMLVTVSEDPVILLKRR